MRKYLPAQLTTTFPIFHKLVAESESTLQTKILYIILVIKPRKLLPNVQNLAGVLFYPMALFGVITGRILNSRIVTVPPRETKNGIESYTIPFFPLLFYTNIELILL
ncbi:hypothetical protein [Lucifera butyrica]|nr:hypothetical protein [Lucifera butyrica]